MTDGESTNVTVSTMKSKKVFKLQQFGDNLRSERIFSLIVLFTKTIFLRLNHSALTAALLHDGAAESLYKRAKVQRQPSSDRK